MNYIVILFGKGAKIMINTIVLYLYKYPIFLGSLYFHSFLCNRKRLKSILLLKNTYRVSKMDLGHLKSYFAFVFRARQFSPSII